MKRNLLKRATKPQRRKPITGLSLESLETRTLLSGNPTQISLLLSPLTTLVKQSVTATATVQGTNNQHPTGNVEFFLGSTKIGSSALSSSEQASFTTSTLPVGSDSLTAVYEGDSNDLSSTSAPITETVSLVPTITSLTATSQSVYVGRSVTFSVGVTENGETNTPTGSVQFFSGTTELGSVNLNKGTATFTTSNLQVGSQSITAVYEGDTTNQTSVSSALNESVLGIPSSSPPRHRTLYSRVRPLR